MAVAIEAFYGGRTAVRSGVPAIRHVDEGSTVTSSATWGRHERSDALVVYFRNWLRALSVSEDSYRELATLLSQHNVDPA